LANFFPESEQTSHEEKNHSIVVYYSDSILLMLALCNSYLVSFSQDSLCLNLDRKVAIR